jgi:hypothetical protein
VAGTGALTITTNDGGSNGDFHFASKGHIEFWDAASNLTINGRSYILRASLKNFRRALRNGDGAGQYFAQAKNWNLSNHLYTVSPIAKQFNGTLEGLGNLISHLNVQDNTYAGDVALIAALGASGTIRDVTLTKAAVVGGTQNQWVGGLLGGSAGTVLNCRVEGTVSANGPSSRAGGLMATNGGTVLNSSADAIVSNSASALFTGGLIGGNLSNVGDPAIVRESYSGGMISAGDGFVGGLIGETDGGTISNGYSSATVVGSGSAAVGGLIGLYALGPTATPKLFTSYSISAVSGALGAVIGGVIGEDEASGSGLSSDYWDLETSGISDPSQGAGNVPNDPGINGLIDAQLKSGLPAGLNPSVWAQNPKINNGYPYLINNPPAK